MKTQAQVMESVQRFQESFWNRKSTGRPPVGIYDEGIFLPINFLRRPFLRPTVCPEDLNGDLVATEYEYSFANSAVTCDDYMPFSAPWRGIPWLEAACGCAVRYSEGSLAPCPLRCVCGRTASSFSPRSQRLARLHAARDRADSSPGSARLLG